MEKKLNLREQIARIFCVIAGNVIYALAVKFFLIPGGLVTGGSTGIALAVNHLSGISVSGFVLVFNVIMLAAGFLVLGSRFALTTIISTFTYSRRGVYRRHGCTAADSAEVLQGAGVGQPVCV